MVQLKIDPTPIASSSNQRSVRRILVNVDVLRAEKLIAGDLVKVTAGEEGSNEAFCIVIVWPSPSVSADTAILFPAHLEALSYPSTILMSKLRSIPVSGLKDVTKMEVVEVLDADEDFDEEEEQDGEREADWKSVAVKEGAVDLKYVTPYSKIVLEFPTRTRKFQLVSIDGKKLENGLEDRLGKMSLTNGVTPKPLIVDEVWNVTWATEVVLKESAPAQQLTSAKPKMVSSQTVVAATTAGADRETDGAPSYTPTIYPPSSAEAPSTPYSSLGGLTPQITLIRTLIDLPLLHPSLFTHLSLPPPRGILLHGPPGTGKTHLARAIASSSPGCSCIVINGPELSSQYHGETESRLRDVFDAAKAREPCIIVFDEIDAICPKRGEGSGEVGGRVVAQLLTLMDGMGSGDDGNKRVVVIACTNRPNAIDAALRRPGRFDREIEIGIPDISSRLSILQVLLSKIPHTLTPDDLQSIASKTHGYVGADLSSLVRESGTIAIKSHLALHPQDYQPLDLHITLSDVLTALPQIRPSAMREVFLETPAVRWADIGGQADVKQKLKECVEWPLTHADTFARLGVRPPRGVLLYGPPGCSKTLTAKALATESGINFLAVKGPELINKYVGESERAVREVFRKARAAAPSIIFFDEIDALGASRSGDGEDSHTDGILTSLLNEMDGIEELNGVTVVAATNRPDVIDAALLRPGRLDRILYVGPPSLAARVDIFNLRMSHMTVEDGVDIDQLALMTEGCSGAEVVSICQDAAIRAMNADINAPFVRREDFIVVAKSVRRRITPDMVSFFESWRDQSGVRSA